MLGLIEEVARGSLRYGSLLLRDQCCTGRGNSKSVINVESYAHPTATGNGTSSDVDEMGHSLFISDNELIDEEQGDEQGNILAEDWACQK